MDGLAVCTAAQKEARKRLADLLGRYLFTGESSISDCAERMGACLDVLCGGIENSDDVLSELNLLQTELGIPQNELMDAVRPFLHREGA